MNAGEQLIAQGYAQGFAEGYARGLALAYAQGLRQAIRIVLASRDLALSEQAEACVSACSDVEELTSWVCRIATAASDEDLFAGGTK